MALPVSGRVLKRAEKELAQSKVILRHLPPDFTEEKLRRLIDPFPSCTHFYFVNGNEILGKFGCSRTYMNFTECEEIVQFRDKYDGKVLETEKGVKYRLIIELAPYQSVPRGRSKPDHRCGTILDDPEYREFLERYEKPVDPLPSIDVTYLHDIEKMRVESIQTTPLTEYLRDRYSTPRSHRGGGQRNKVLYATGSRKKRDKGKESKAKRRDKEGKGDVKERESQGGGGRDTSTGSSKTILVEKVSTKTYNGYNGVEEASKKDKGPKAKSAEAVDTPMYKDRAGSHRSRQKPDQQLYAAGGGRKDSKKRMSEEREHVKRPKESEGKRRGYPKYGKGRYNDRHDNQYEFKEDDDNYQGPDHKISSRSSQSGDREYDRDEKRGGGRYYGRGKGYDRYGDSSRGGWGRGYHSHK